MNNRFESLTEILDYRAKSQPGNTAYIFLNKDRETKLTYTELDLKSKAVAAALQSNNVKGERALLLYPPGLEFISAFMGCLYSGTIAVPAYPPDINRIEHTIARLRAIVADSQAKVVLTTEDILFYVKMMPPEMLDTRGFTIIATDSLKPEQAADYRSEKITGDTLAFLQYTSGSTGNPKGVMVSHTNLVYNSQEIYRMAGHTPDSVYVCWLPLYHDMGLIGGIIQPLYGGFRGVLMSPVSFLKKPFRWLKAISDYHGTTSPFPNFALDLAVRKTLPEERDTLDLSTWKVACNGAEPVRKESIDRFNDYFKSCGLRPETMYPAYGLAEATLIVSGGRRDDLPEFKTLNIDSLDKGKAEPDSSGKTITGCGKTLEGQKIAVVNPETGKRCKNNEIGEIWVSGPSIAQGYWNKPEETDYTFKAVTDEGEGPFLRTGDLGFTGETGELFITGRIKDLIITGGRNIYPQDIERTIEELNNTFPEIRPGCSAAFAVDVNETEQVVVFQELAENYGDPEKIIEEAAGNIARNHQISIYSVVLLKKGTLPKTSSGKIMRFACKKMFTSGFQENKEIVIKQWVRENVPELYLSAEEKPPAAKPEKQTELNIPEAKGNTPNLSKAEELLAWLRDYARENINSRVIDERRCIPPHLVLDFGERGLMGLLVPKKYGGPEFSHHDFLKVGEQLSAIDLTLGIFTGLNNTLGLYPIINFAGEKLKEELLPGLAKGRKLAAFALTEAGAGSSPREISTSVEETEGGWKLNGNKIWTGLGSWAGVINVFGRNKGKPGGMSGFVINKGTKGISNGPEALTMGLRGIVQNEVILKDVLVTPGQLLGQAGKGFDVAARTMMFTRFGIGGISLGGLKRCFQLMYRYASRRAVSTGRLLENPVTQMRLNQLSWKITALETYVYRIAGLLDQGIGIPEEAYIACKTTGPEFLSQTADQLIQLLGGRGYIDTNFAPQLYRDARILRIFEGPTETLNMYLGSKVINSFNDLKVFMDNCFNAADIAYSLNNAAEEIKEKILNQASFETNTARLQMVYSLAGELASIALLWAAVREKKDTTVNGQLTAEWLKSEFKQLHNQALSRDNRLNNQDQLERLNSLYELSIGNIEQSLPGEDDSTDQYLRINFQQAQDINQPPLPEIEKGEETIITAGSQLIKDEVSEATRQYKADIQAQGEFSAEGIEDWLSEWICRETGIHRDKIIPDQPFTFYGLDSVKAVMLADDLENWTGITLYETLAWDYPSIRTLAGYLAGEITSGDKTSGHTPKPAEIENILDDLENLTDEEVQEALKRFSHEQVQEAMIKKDMSEKR